MKNYDLIMSFQMSSSNYTNTDHVVEINLNINKEKYVYNENFEWGLENTPQK